MFQWQLWLTKCATNALTPSRVTRTPLSLRACPLATVYRLSELLGIVPISSLLTTCPGTLLVLTHARMPMQQPRCSERKALVHSGYPSCGSRRSHTLVSRCGMSPGDIALRSLRIAERREPTLHRHTRCRGLPQPRDIRRGYRLDRAAPPPGSHHREGTARYPPSALRPRPGLDQA